MNFHVWIEETICLQKGCHLLYSLEPGEYKKRSRLLQQIVYQWALSDPNILIGELEGL